jgi:hypothetical protein
MDGARVESTFQKIDDRFLFRNITSIVRFDMMMAWHGICCSFVLFTEIKGKPLEEEEEESERKKERKRERDRNYARDLERGGEGRNGYMECC